MDDFDLIDALNRTIADCARLAKDNRLDAGPWLRMIPVLVDARNAVILADARALRLIHGNGEPVQA